MDLSQIILFIILILFSAFFSGSEIALMSLAPHKIDALLKKGAKGAKTLKNIKKKSGKLLIAILIGNNFVNVYTAALATQISLSLARNSGLGISESTMVALATGFVTILILLFGEIAPKSFAIKNSEKISLFVAKFYKIFIIVLYPLILVVLFITRLFTGKEKTNKITDEEFEAFIDMGKKEGQLEVQEHKKIKKLLDFRDITAEEVMTPRIKIERLEDIETIDNAINFMLKSTHNRIPVYSNDIDHIIGFITLRKLLKRKGQGYGELQLKSQKKDFYSVIKIPLNKPIDDLFTILQKKHQHFSIVLDEYGGVAGIVTLEDIIEEIFGEIQDETDKEKDISKKISDGKYVFDSSILLRDIFEQLSIDISSLNIDKLENIEDIEDYEGETLSYFITAILERFPKKGEVIKLYFDRDDDSKLEIKMKVLDIKDGMINDIEFILVN